MTQIVRKNDWRHKIQIKDMFEDETTPELIITLCDKLIYQLQKIKEEEEVGDLTDEYKDSVSEALETVIDNFEFLKQFANGEISEEQWDDYAFDGDFESLFNDYMNQLYDICDERVETTKNTSVKFIWIN